MNTALPHKVLELPPEPASITIARKAMAEVAREVGAPAHDVELAVSEAVSNAVIHAFRGREPGRIRISPKVEGDTLRITVEDDGTGMAPNLDSPGLGFGVSLITKMATEVSIDCSDGGTTVAMAFPRSGEGTLG